MKSKIHEVSKLFNVNMDYTRVEHKDYDKCAVLEFDKNYANKHLNFVLEVDFNSYYPQAIINNKDSKYPP